MANYTIQHECDEYKVYDELNILKYRAVRKKEFSFEIFEFNIEKVNDSKKIEIIPKRGYKKYLANIWLLNYFFKESYLLYVNGVQAGAIDHSHLCYSLIINVDEYAVRLHKKSIISIWKNGAQIGVMKRVKRAMKGIVYDVEFLDENDDHIISLCIFAITSFLRAESAMSDPEDSLVISVWRDKFSDAAYWGVDGFRPNKRKKMIDNVIHLALVLAFLTVIIFIAWMSWFNASSPEPEEGDKELGFTSTRASI